MPVVTWDHVHLRSPDPEATAAWLRDILGGEIVQAPGRIDVNLGGARIFIAPLEGDNVVNPPPPHPHQGLDHFGLTVKDIDAVAAEIKARASHSHANRPRSAPACASASSADPKASPSSCSSATRNTPDKARAASAHRSSCRPVRLSHATGHESADGDAHVAVDRPDHGASQSVSESAEPSASEQQGPLPLRSPSNQAFNSALALTNWPRSRAWPKGAASAIRARTHARLATVRQHAAPPIRRCRVSQIVGRTLYRRGFSPLESIQLLTFVLLQHPAASATMVMHFAGQLDSQRLASLHDQTVMAVS